MNFIISETQLKEIKQKLKETPDTVYNGNLDVAEYPDSDSIAFGFYSNEACVGFNYSLFLGSNLSSEKNKAIIGDLASSGLKRLLWHDKISLFYSEFLNDQHLPKDRDNFNFPGRLWFDKKIISFWKYPLANKLISLLNKLSDEIYKIYGFKINFNDYQIEIKTFVKVNDTGDIVPEYVLIPIKDFIGSENASSEEMKKMHLLPSEEKRKAPQMQAFRKEGEKMLADKFKNTSQAEWNAAKNKYMGESTNKNTLKETPDSIHSDGEEIAVWSDADALCFGFYRGHAYVSLNYVLANNSKNFDYETKKKIDNMSGLDSHDDIYYFYKKLIGENDIPIRRLGFDFPGRLWFDKKIISFWIYPDINKLKNLLNLLSNEIYKIYGTKINFNDYQIEIKGQTYTNDLNTDDEDFVPDTEWQTSQKNGILIPISKFIGSENASSEEMKKMHLLPSAEKRKTPQMQAFRKEGEKILGNKFKNVSQAEWNAAKNKYMGESTGIYEDINIPVNTGDTVLMGKFKNKKTVVKNIGVDDYNMPTINGKKAATFRMTEDEITKVRQGIMPYEDDVMGKQTSMETGRVYIDWNSNYGKSFKIVSTPKGSQSGGKWDKNLISIITPENGNAWANWIEVPVNILNNWRNNWDNIQKSLGEYKYDQIIRCSNKINEVLEKDVNLSSFETKKELNTNFWNNKKLNSKVRRRLLKIADDFLDFVNVDSKYCKDILLLGSMSNYNWSKYSDVDLHLLVDFSKINKDTTLVKDYFDAKRKIWNDEHKLLKIYNFPIELYIQDVSEENASIGIFSIEKNKWIKIPQENQDDELDKNKIRQKSADIMTKIDKLKDRYDKKTDVSDLENISNDAKHIFDNIKKLRKSGLESKTGEFSVGNIVFKVLRRSGHLNTLIDIKRNSYDKINTIK